MAAKDEGQAAAWDPQRMCSERVLRSLPNNSGRVGAGRHEGSAGMHRSLPQYTAMQARRMRRVELGTMPNRIWRWSTLHCVSILLSSLVDSKRSYQVYTKLDGKLLGGRVHAYFRAPGSFVQQ